MPRRKLQTILGQLRTELAAILGNEVVISRVLMSRARYKQERSPLLFNVRREGIAV